MPSGLTEEFIVEDRGFYNAIGAFEAHFQCKVSKKNSTNFKRSKQIIYNLYGQHSKVNNQSNDKSITVINVSKNDVFKEILEVANEKCGSNPELIEVILEMKEASNKNSFINSYQKFISLIANHMTIFSPFIPALTQMLN